MHYPYFDLFFKSLSFQKGKKNIVTIYDTIPLIYPKNYPPGIKGKINFLRQKSTLKEADAIVTISETSKKDIVRFLDVQSEKVHVTYLAATPDFKKLPSGKWSTEIRQKYHLPEKFVLYVGDVNYNKNINNLAKACKITDVPLVLAGKQAASSDFDRNHPENQSLVHLLEEYGYDHQVLRLGFVPQEDLVKISYEEIETWDKALPRVDVLYQTRIQKERFNSPAEYKKYKGVYVLTMKEVNKMKKGAIVMHPLPRVDEIATEVDRSEKAVYFKQAKYGLLIRMALLKEILGR